MTEYSDIESIHIYPEGEVLDEGDGAITSHISSTDCWCEPVIQGRIDFAKFRSIPIVVHSDKIMVCVAVHEKENNENI